MPKIKLKTVDEYIQAAPRMARQKLRELRAILKTVAPKAEQTLKWGSPVFIEKRILFAFAAFKTHINFMPTPAAIKKFKKQLTKYTTGLGSIQFPYDRPLPTALIRKIAAFRAKELKEKDARWM